MPGPAAKGPRLWLQPERQNPNGSTEAAVWLIRDDGGFKRSTGRVPGDRGGAEQDLAEYIAKKHAPDKRKGDSTAIDSADVLNLYMREVVPGHARPKESIARLTRLATWWGQPAHAMRTMTEMEIPVVRMTGRVADVRTGSCQAYVQHVGATRSARMDLEMFRAAVNHAVGEGVLTEPVKFWLPDDAEPRQDWLTRRQAAIIIWRAWRSRRKANAQTGEADKWGARQHLARWAIVAHYTGTRSRAICAASFEKKIGFGYIDLDNGVWYRQPIGKKATKKRNPPQRLPAPLLAHMRRWEKKGLKHPVEFHGEPVQRIGRAMRGLLRECQELAGFGPEIVPHCFRHTAITWSMQSGTDPWQAAGYFGIDLQTLLDVYGHHHPDYMSEAVEASARSRRHRQGSDRVSGTN